MLCYEFPPIGGGGSRVVEGLGREFVRCGDRVDLMTMRYSDLPKKENIEGMWVYRIPCVRFKKYYCTIPEVFTYQLSGLLYIIRLVQSLKPDLIHAHFIFPDGLLARWVSSINETPFLITAHGTDVPGFNPHRARRAHTLLAPIWRNTTRRARTIVCPSDRIRKLVLRQVPETDTTVVPNGFEPTRFRIVKKKNIILVATRILERKGIQYLFNALEDLDLSWEIIIAGDGPYLPVLKKKANVIKAKVRFTGWLDHDSAELSDLFETSSIFVFPSDSENFPICLLEAMASGNAIITSSSSGCEEVTGSTAWIVPPKDPGAIRKALLELTENDELRKQMGNQARKRLEQRFSWSVVADQYRSVYRRFVNLA